MQLLVNGNFVFNVGFGDVKFDFMIMVEEIFGFVVFIVCFKIEDEVVVLVNNIEYGFVVVVFINNIN